MHSGYRRYERYFMAYREMCKTHYSATNLKNVFVLSTNSSMGQQVWFLDEIKLTSVSYSSVLRSDSSDFPYYLQRTWKHRWVDHWEKCSLSHSYYIYNMSVYPVSLIRNLKHHTWNVGLPPFQETWILKAFFTFHTLKIKPRMTDQPFIALQSFTNNGIDVCVPRWWSQSLQVWGPAGWSARPTNREKSQWCWNISRALGKPEHTDQKMFMSSL